MNLTTESKRGKKNSLAYKQTGLCHLWQRKEIYFDQCFTERKRQRDKSNSLTRKHTLHVILYPIAQAGSNLSFPHSHLLSCHKETYLQCPMVNGQCSAASTIAIANTNATFFYLHTFLSLFLSSFSFSPCTCTCILFLFASNLASIAGWKKVLCSTCPSQAKFGHLSLTKTLAICLCTLTLTLHLFWLLFLVAFACFSLTH